MSEHGPDLDSLIDDDRFAQVHDVLVRAGPPPELPDLLARPPAVAVRRLSVGSPEP